jgi:hypothetical protein
MSNHPAPQASVPVNYRHLFIKAAVFFVVISAGIATGIVIATKLGVADLFTNTTITPEQLDNDSKLRLGDPFPILEAVGADGEVQDLIPLLQGRKCIVAIVSAGCQPCHRFVKFLKTTGLGATADFQVVLLAPDPVPFHEETDLTVLQVIGKILVEHEIHAFPTIIGVSDDGRIALVASGFSRRITEEFLRDNI